jgi:hypothetical protein
MNNLIKGCEDILNMHCENGTLVNQQIIAKLNNVINGRLLK